MIKSIIKGLQPIYYLVSPKHDFRAEVEKNYTRSEAIFYFLTCTGLVAASSSIFTGLELATSQALLIEFGAMSSVLLICFFVSAMFANSIGIDTETDFSPLLVVSIVLMTICLLVLTPILYLAAELVGNIQADTARSAASKDPWEGVGIGVGRAFRGLFSVILISIYLLASYLLFTVCMYGVYGASWRLFWSMLFSLILYLGISIGLVAILS